MLEFVVVFFIVSVVLYRVGNILISKYLNMVRLGLLSKYRLTETQIHYFMQTNDKMYVEIERAKGKFIRGILWVDNDGLVNIQSGGKVFPYQKSTGKDDILQLVKFNIAKLYRYSVVDEMLKRGLVVGV